MPFNGGGGGAITPHVHNAVPLQGGPLDFVNDTISSMNAGSVTFSSGAALQELVIGNPSDALVVNGAGNAPEWAAGASAGAYTFLQTETLGADTNSWTVNLTTPYQVATNGSLVIELESLETNGAGLSTLAFTYNNFANQYYISWQNQLGSTVTNGLNNNQTSIPLITNITTTHKINAQLQFFNNPLTENTNYTRNINFSAYNTNNSEWRIGRSHREDTVPFTTEITEINFSLDNGDLAQDSIINIYVVTN